MLLAQMSDLHFSPKQLAESAHCFGHAIDVASARGARCAVISGDATDHALDAHAPAFESLVRLVLRLANHMPVLMLQGTWSHEPPGTLNIFRLLGARHPLHVADRIEQVALLGDGSWLPSSSWHFDKVPLGAVALFSCLPTLNKATVAGVVGGEAAAAKHGTLIADVLAGFESVNAAAATNGVPTIGVSHGTVNGCTSEHGVPMAGLDHEFTTGSLFSAGTAAFMLGHIHKHQAWWDGRRAIAYPGSIGRFHFGEEGEKGFLLWDVDAEGCAFELMPTPARRTIELEFDGVPDAAALAEVTAELDGAHVRVRWAVDEGDESHVDRAEIERVLTAAGAAAVKLEGAVRLVTRSRVPGIGAATTVAEKLARWAESTGQKLEPLAARLSLLDALDPERIVADVLAQLGGASGSPLPNSSKSAAGTLEPQRQAITLFE